MSLASKSFSVLGRDLFLLFSSLLSSVVIARTLGPEIMGIWVILNTIPSYAEMLGRTKVDLSAVYFLGKGKYKLGDITNALNIIAASSSLLILVLIAIFYDSIVLNLLKDNADLYSIYMMAILIVIPFNLFYMNYMYLHIFNEDVKSINYMILARALFMFLTFIPGLIFFNFEIPQLVFCFITSYGLALIVGVSRYKHQHRDGPFINKKLIKDLFSYAYKMYISGLLLNLNSYIANTFLILYGSPAQITFYALAQQFSIILLKITDSMNTFIFPSASKKDPNDAKIYIAKAFRTASVLMFPIGIISAILISPSVYIIYGSSFLPIIEPFRILLIGVIFSSITSTICMYFMSSGRPEIITRTLIIPVTVQLVVSPYIIPLYGIQGAAVALSTGMVLGGFAQIIAFLRLTRLNFKDDLVFKKQDVMTVISFIKSLNKSFK
jgi:O-antigen/teichoic acid export membrane protein